MGTRDGQLGKEKDKEKTIQRGLGTGEISAVLAKLNTISVTGRKRHREKQETWTKLVFMNFGTLF